MKKILVTAGGTATAWHIATIANKYFKDKIAIQVSDTNECDLVPASTIVSKTHRVANSLDKDYINQIEKIIEKEKIDCIIPLIPAEAYLFAADSEFITSHRIQTTIPEIEVINQLNDKQNLYDTLCFLDIPTPLIYSSKDSINSNENYLLKPRLGFGSLGVKIEKGEAIKNEWDNISGKYIVQEYCHEDSYDEVTVEVYNGSAGLHIFARRRLETKSGVCVKMEPIDNQIFYPYIKKLVEEIKCPKAFNVQFLWNNEQWKLFDCNLRLGAGTALSTAMGFQLTKALLLEILGERVNQELFEIDKEIKKVLRVYQEIIIR